MTKLTWVVLTLFLLGNAFFVLPVHISRDNISTQYSVNYKKDTPLLQTAFADTSIRLELNMAGRYLTWYQDLNKKIPGSPQHPLLHINVAVSHDLGFTPLAFPFYKSANFDAQMAYQSVIINSEQIGVDSVALIGNIIVRGKLRILGICTPLHAKELVERELVRILNNEMNKLEQDINQHLKVSFAPPPSPVKERLPARRSRKRK